MGDETMTQKNDLVSPRSFPKATPAERAVPRGHAVPSSLGDLRGRKAGDAQAAGERAPGLRVPSPAPLQDSTLSPAGGTAEVSSLTV